MSPNTKAWLHGLFAAAIGSFATAAGGVLTLPSVFNFSHNGLINFAKISVIPAAVAVCAYLKQSPLPPLNVKTTEHQEASLSKDPSGTETATSTKTVTTEVTPTKQ